MSLYNPKLITVIKKQNSRYSTYIIPPIVPQPLVGKGLLTITLKTHYIRQNSSGREISPSQRRLKTYDTHKRQMYIPPAGFEPANSSKLEASDPRLRPRDHWDRPAYRVKDTNPQKNSTVQDLLLLHNINNVNYTNVTILINKGTGIMINNAYFITCKTVNSLIKTK
jgi:hypothetical protein